VSGDLVLINIGTIVTGDLTSPIAEGDTIVVQQGVITGIGYAGDFDLPVGVARIDVAGATVIPGLRDNHVHPVFGDFTPRQSTVNFIDSCLHGGVTTMYSAGEPHIPGRPTDPAGVKALALLAHLSFRNARPSGVKVHAGAVLLEPGLVEQDFEDLALAGCRLVGEIGISGLKDPTEAAQMTRWAQARQMKVMVHTGGASIPGSGVIGPDFVAEVQPDVAGHVNGGPTSLPVHAVADILDRTNARVEIVHNGNITTLGKIVQLVRERNELHRLVAGTDCPAGSGVQPLGMLRVMASAASLGGIDGATAVAIATGNVADLHDDSNGRIAIGSEADLLVVDTPLGSTAPDAMSALEFGDTLAVAFAVIDGVIVVSKSRNTPPPARNIKFLGQS
jgi:enamidase